MIILTVAIFLLICAPLTFFNSEERSASAATAPAVTVSVEANIGANFVVQLYNSSDSLVGCVAYDGTALSDVTVAQSLTVGNYTVKIIGPTYLALSILVDSTEVTSDVFSVYVGSGQTVSLDIEKLSFTGDAVTDKSWLTNFIG